MTNDQHFDDNRANWDDRVPIHLEGDVYDLDGLVANPDQLSSIVEGDREHLGNVSGKSLVHLQCHIGTDTLSWAKLGATVTGLDFSAASLAAARDLADRLGVDARFVEANVYDAVEALGDTYDIVYTGVGAIGWLPDIERWAETVAALTKPGGTFYIKEGHPFLWALDDELDDGSLVVKHPYFERPDPTTWDYGETYGGEGKVGNSVSHEWNHGLGEIVTALIGHGFRIDLLVEHREVNWQALPQMIQRGDVWVLPDDQRDLVPLMYSLKATKTA